MAYLLRKRISMREICPLWEYVRCHPIISYWQAVIIINIIKFNMCLETPPPYIDTEITVPIYRVIAYIYV